MRVSRVVAIASLALLSRAAQGQGSFTVSASPDAGTVTQGNSVSSSVTITPAGGFNANVALSVSGLGSCGKATLSPTTLSAPYSKPSTLTITTTGSCNPQDYPITVAGTPAGGGAPQNATFTLTVSQAAGNTPSSISDTLKNNFGFGVALGLSTNVFGPDMVTNATIDANGIVRVNTRANTTAGLMLETHYYIWPRVTSEMLAGTAPDNRTWGHGPFVAAQPGTSQIISAVGAGWMFGFRRPKGSTPSGFGLGVGYEAIPAAQVLGSEFVNGKPAPVDSKGNPLPIRYETQDKGSVLVVLSVTF